MLLTGRGLLTGSPAWLVRQGNGESNSASTPGPDPGCWTNDGGPRIGARPAPGCRSSPRAGSPAGPVDTADRRLAGRGGVRLMGWNNPNVPWSELERALSGRPPLPGRGPLRPIAPLEYPSSQRRDRPQIEHRLGGRRGDPGALRRAALPLRVQLPGRRLHPGAPGRGGAAARAGRAGHHRPRRPLRHRPVRRGGRATPACAPCTAPNCPSACPSRRWASPTRSVSTCWCSPAARRDTTGCPCRSAAPSWTAGRRAARSTTWTRWPTPRRTAG